MILQLKKGKEFFQFDVTIDLAAYKGYGDNKEFKDYKSPAMHIFACDAAEQVVALYNTRQCIRPNTNTVVGTITHRAMLNGYIYSTQ